MPFIPVNFPPFELDNWGENLFPPIVWHHESRLKAHPPRCRSPKKGIEKNLAMWRRVLAAAVVAGSLGSGAAEALEATSELPGLGI